MREENPSVMAEYYFNVEPTPTQHKLMKTILYGKNRRIIISAMTRYGKSMTISMTVLLYAILNERKRIVLVSPTYKQARILMEWIANYVVTSNEVANELDTQARGVERLKKEVTKERITFKNGSEIRILSAEGKGERLMGFGADMIVEDESALISDEVYRSRILRMLGDRPDEAILIQIGNPFPGNHFEENWKERTDWIHYHINWNVALEEGRTTIGFIEEQREILTPDEFKILYEAEFPEEAEDALIRYAWIKEAYENTFEYTEADIRYKVIGLDVAEGGVDWTVATFIHQLKDGQFVVKEIKHWHKADTMETVGWVLQLCDTWKPNRIMVDAIGVGKGVCDRLKETTKGVSGVKVGEKATMEKKRFFNKKAQYYWMLRKAFEKGEISIPKHNQLIKELRQLRYEVKSDRNIHILDPGKKDKKGVAIGEDKSPDFADSLMLGCSVGSGGTIIW